MAIEIVGRVTKSSSEALVIFAGAACSAEIF